MHTHTTTVPLKSGSKLHRFLSLIRIEVFPDLKLKIRLLFVFGNGETISDFVLMLDAS